MNYNNYPSLGIDHKIKIMQNAIHLNLGFEGVDFYGRVQKVISKDGKTFVPEVHVSNLERKEVFYDDRNAPGGNVFFVDAEQHTTKDGKLFTAKIKIVFMLNLNKLLKETVVSIEGSVEQYVEKNYRTDAEIQNICMKLIQRIKGIEITGLEKGIKNILNDFNVDRLKLNDMQPFHTFSINGDLKYIFNCNQ